MLKKHRKFRVDQLRLLKIGLDWCDAVYLTFDFQWNTFIYVHVVKTKDGLLWHLNSVRSKLKLGVGWDLYIKNLDKQ